MGYYIDLEKITIRNYSNKIKSAYLPPSRMMLKEKPDERFGYFKNMGIKNVKELLQLLKKKDKFAELQKLDLFSGDYLTILLRELNSTLPKPNKIAEFAGISKENVSKLEQIGITNTEKLYDRIVSSDKRHDLALSTGIKDSDILELSCLTDLSRIKWVGVAFARMLYDLGIDTAEKASKSDPVDLHFRINQLNKTNGIFRGHIGLNDIKIFVAAAKEIPFDIEY